MRRVGPLIFTTAIATRLLAAVLAFATSPLEPSRLPQLRDGASFLAYATAVTQGREGFQRLSEYDRRVFPGYPLFLVAVGAHRWPLMGILFNWIAAAGAAFLAYRLYEDERIGWATAVLTPSYVLYSTTLMSEAVVLLAGVAGLYLAKRSRFTGAGLAFAFAAVARPLAAAFGLACLTIMSWRSGSFRKIAAITFAVIGVVAVWLWWWSGSSTSGIEAFASSQRAYGGDRIFSWPFASLLRITLQTSVPAWKIAYVWTHVAIVLVGIILLVRERKTAHLSLVWLASNTAIVLCIGGIWGFHEFHRFIIPALPPLFFAYRRFLPRNRGVWIVLACVSAAVAAKALGHGW